MMSIQVDRGQVVHRQPVDRATFPRINGRAWWSCPRINGRAFAHKRSRLYIEPVFTSIKSYLYGGSPSRGQPTVAHRQAAPTTNPPPLRGRPLGGCLKEP